MKKIETKQMETVTGGSSFGNGIGCIRDILTGSAMAAALGVATALAICIILY